MMLKKLRKRQILLFICMLNVTLVFSQEIADNDVLQSALEKGALAADYWINDPVKIQVLPITMPISAHIMVHAFSVMFPGTAQIIT